MELDIRADILNEHRATSKAVAMKKWHTENLLEANLTIRTSDKEGQNPTNGQAKRDICSHPFEILVGVTNS